MFPFDAQSKISGRCFKGPVAIFVKVKTFFYQFMCFVACPLVFMSSCPTVTDVREPVVLVPVLLRLLRRRHDQLLGAGALQPALHLRAAAHLRRPGPGPQGPHAAPGARALPDRPELQGES